MAKWRKLHEWDVPAKQATEIQRELAEQVRIEPLPSGIELVAGADISFDKFSPVIFAGIVVLRLPTLEIVERSGVQTTTKFPYVPGLLSFREIPALIEAWDKLRTEPDAVVLDGQGLAHPRRMGLACHAGLIFDKPTIGCAKSLFVGNFAVPAPERGSWSPLLHRDETVGAVLRTKNKIAPVFASPGHKSDLNGAIDLLLKLDAGYRIPEATRQAHLFVNELRTAAKDAAEAPQPPSE
jgi:deoxyribonuclease V